MPEDGEVAEELWIGRGEVEPLPGADAEITGATWAVATVIVYASSAEDFLTQFEDALATSHLGLVKFEQAVPAHEWFHVDEDFFASVAEAAQSGDPVLHVLNTDQPADAEDEDTVALTEAAASHEAVQFRLIGSDDWIPGFALAVSDEWALLQSIELRNVSLDGYLAVRLDEVIDVELVDTRLFIFRVLDEPRDPELPLADHRSILTALADRYALVELGEVADDANVAIGRILEVADDRVTLAGVSTAGDVIGEFEHAYEDIRLIGFGSAYLEALASVVP